VIQAGRCDNKGQALEDWAEVLKRDEPVVYNKPDVLNPFFVVYGRRTPAAAAAGNAPTAQ
jgi:3'(2'), 5'-bisphosphate nucleotidase